MDSKILKTVASEKLITGEAFFAQKSINDKYIIERKLGEGGMGLTYLASGADDINRKVVVKTILQELSTPEGKAAFLKEGEALGRINHDGVVKLFDKGEDNQTGLPFLVMEYVQGKALTEFINVGQMSLKRVVNITEKIAFALNAAHNERVLHRDLKPDNIMIIDNDIEGEKVKLIDFGVAKVADSVVGVETTQVGSFKGTMQYASPEQLSGVQTIGGETYNLALLTYELMTQKRPFPITVTKESNESNASFYGRAFEQIKRLQKEGAENPRNFNLQISEKTADVILKGLEYDLNDRYEKPVDFSNDLKESLEFTAIEIDQPEPKPLFNKIAFSLLAVFTLLVLSFLAYLWLNSSNTNKTSSINSNAGSSPTPIVAIQPEKTLFSYSFEVQKMKNNIIDGETFVTNDKSKISIGDKFNLKIRQATNGYFYLIKQNKDQYQLLASNDNEDLATIEGWHLSNPNQKFWVIWSKDEIQIFGKKPIDQGQVADFVQKNNKTLETQKNMDIIEVKGSENIGIYQLVQ